MNRNAAISASPTGCFCKTISEVCKTSEESEAKSSTSVGNGVTVAQQTLTLFVLVRIQVPQPTRMIGEVCSVSGTAARSELRHFCNKSKRFAECSFQLSVGPRRVRNNEIQEPPLLHRLLV